MSLTLAGVSHQYQPDKFILSDITLSIVEGEAVALTGPSGSGKTTLLSILGLLLRPTHGTLVVDGVIPPRREHDRSQLRARSYAWVFQSSNALGHRSAIDNAALGLLAKGATREQAQAKANDALLSVGLGALTNQPAFSLSGGELQRMCIARAIASEPKFVLADEPTGQLDQQTSQQVLDALWAARQPTTALVMATHDLEAARRCDRIVRLENGRLVD